MNSVISVIIPCFNSGKYVIEAIDSVLGSKGASFEIIIIDDGSTDVESLDILRQLRDNGYTVLHQQNQGPGAARNAGVRNSNGSFLMFLDSDNKVRPTYFNKAIEVLMGDPRVGVVYGKPNFFGSDSTVRFTPKSFEIDSLLTGNYIDMCSIVRRSVWEEVGGFDETRIIMAHADWEFWIRIGLKGWRFHFIDEVLFDYRVREDSLINTLTDDPKRNALEFIANKHGIVYYKRYKYYFKLYHRFERRPFLYFLKMIYSKYVLRRKYLP